MLRLPRSAASLLNRRFQLLIMGRTYTAQKEFILKEQVESPTVEWPPDEGMRQQSTPAMPEEISPKDLGNLVRSRSLEELLPLAVRFIDLERLELAEAIITTMEKNHNTEWKKHKDAGIANMFLRGYLERGNLKGAERWRARLFARTQASPDRLTYAILFSHYLKKDSKKECRMLAEQLAIDGIPIEQVFELEYLSPDQTSRLLFILNLTPSQTADNLISLSNLTEDLVIQPKAVLRNVDQFPEVISIKTKSDGISFLKSSIQVLKENPSADLYAVQEQLERDCYTATTQRIRSEMESYRAATKATIYTFRTKRLLAQWQNVFSNRLRSALRDAANLHETSTRSIRVGVGILYSSILSALEVEKISLIVLQELTRTASYDFYIGGQIMSRLAISVGQSLEREVFAQQISRKEFLQHTQLKPRHLARIFNDRVLFETTMRKQYAALERNVDALRIGWIPRWSVKLRTEIAVYVISLAIECLKFVTNEGADDPQSQEVVPAFEHRLVPYQGQRTGAIVAHPELFRLLSSEAACFFVEPWAMPMLVPPKPWLTYNSGGYLTQKMPCVRLKEDPLHLALIHQADKDGRLEKILYGLDTLGRTAWRINDSILRVALEMWNSGINVATLEKPISGEESKFLEFRSKETFSSHEEYVAYVRKAAERKETLSKAHSTMCDTNYKLEIARQFAGLTFYLPHSVDFRGRAYPIPPHLSHVGSDLSRGLLVFAEGKPLGLRGLRWLKIQLANMAGFDKASLDERAAFADENQSEIFDSAENPLTGRQWWRKADEPWQCLATCIELTAALKSPDPTQYISHLPCQQDGSCNGLQHYAALGGDVNGAKQVNLSPSERPQDVYAAVAKLVAAQIEKDAGTNSNHIAGRLVGKINRKIVKQTVMTNVYGVTMYGARQQIQDRLKEYELVGPEHYKDARVYLAQAVFTSLGSLFDGAQKIQKWLTETAQEISRAVPVEVANKFGTAIGTEGQIAEEEDIINLEEEEINGKVMEEEGVEEEKSPLKIEGASSLTKNQGEFSKRRKPRWQETADPSERYPQTSVMWTTPLGFQVLQPYNKVRNVMLKTVLQSLTLRISSKFDPVDVAKQASAFPPNFVHSLDATHMFLTALACNEVGLTFASVHDCFWTHAATVDEMNTILREQFVKMHSQPILESLHKEFTERYRGFLIPEGLSRHENFVAGEIRHIQVAKWRPISIPPIPPRGDFDINQVLKSEYFFS